MKTTLKIAKAELSTLFYSPIAWCLCIVFIFQCGLIYASKVQSYLTLQDLGPQYLQGLNSLTVRIFTSTTGLYASVIGKLYLYIPLLTMGLISRETNSGTIKLLYSSPIKIRQIVLGKFLAMIAYCFLLILIIFCFVIAGVINIHGADAGLLLSGILGIGLLLCAYSAIGLFMSSLTSYQIVAAIGTLALFAALEYVGSLWQDIGFVRDLTYFLSISGRTSHLLLGLISTKDVLYFCLIVYLFIGFTIVKLNAERKSESNTIARAKYLFLFASVMIAGYITSLPALTGYFDASAGKQMTLAPNSQKILEEIGDGALEVTVYGNLLDVYFYNLGRPEQRNDDLKRWEPYLRFKPDIKFNYVYYYDAPNPNQEIFKFNAGKSLKQIAQNLAKSMGMNLADFKTPAEIKQVIDLSSEQNRYVIQLKYKGRTTFLRVFDDMSVYPSETEIDAALKRLVATTFPKIAFLEGELERSINKLGDREYGVFTSQSTFRYALVNQGFDVETVSLQNGDIPKDIAALVIADPKTILSPVVLDKVRKYIDAGGNLLIAGEPGKQAILNPLVQSLGVTFANGALVQKSKDFAPDIIRPFFTEAIKGISTKLYNALADSLSITMPGTAGLTYTTFGPYHITPVTMTDGKLSWNKKERLINDSADVTFSSLQGDEMKSFPTILALTKTTNGKEQRIIVAGDADFISNSELSKSSVNFEFGTHLFGWFTGGAFPIDTTRPESQDKKLDITDSGMKLLKWLSWAIFPGLLLIFSATFLIIRKRK